MRIAIAKRTPKRTNKVVKDLVAPSAARDIFSTPPPKTSEQILLTTEHTEITENVFYSFRVFRAFRGQKNFSEKRNRTFLQIILYLPERRNNRLCLVIPPQVAAYQLCITFKISGYDSKTTFGFSGKQGQQPQQDARGANGSRNQYVGVLHCRRSRLRHCAVHCRPSRTGL